MPIYNTNRLIDPQKERLRAIRIGVARVENRLKLRSRKSLRFAFLKTAKCTQCGFGMRKDWADEQVRNGRENAPICLPCILGKKRKKRRLSERSRNAIKRMNEVAKFRRERRVSPAK